MPFKASIQKWRALYRYSPVVRYGGAVLVVWLCLSLWALNPRIFGVHPLALFLAGVVITARFLGLGPALLCSAMSVLCLDFIVFPRHHQVYSSTGDELLRLGVFLALSVLVGSLVRERTRAELLADRTMREMATIVECSDDAIYSANPDGIITSWNRGAERLYGYPAEEAVGMHVEMLATPEKRDEIEHNARKLNYGATVPAHETERLQKNGSVIPVLLTLSPLRTADGKIVGAFAIARNISAKRQSEEAIRRSEKLATAGRMAASIAHEINNPLEAVLNLLYLARNDPRKAGEYLSMAEREIGRVSRLAQQALGFVRDTKNVTSLDPAAILDEILELYSRKIDAKKIHVLREYRGQSQIHGYSGEVHQLLANLLVNAVDAMEPGGCLRVRVTQSSRWTDGSRGIRVIVADNGKGIPPENLARVFEPFYTTKQDTGTGLGLWVSQGIVQKHGGSIRVRSRAEGPHRGTLFSIFIPSMYVASQVA